MKDPDGIGEPLVNDISISKSPSEQISSVRLFVMVGFVLLEITTSSVLAGHTPLLIVHVNVALVPAGNPVTVVVGEVASVIVTSVFGVLHIPLPTPGVFPANVKSVVSHNVWSDPAADVVGF